MSTVSVSNLYEQLEKTIAQGNSGADMTRIRVAFDYASKAHADQKRRDGSPYVTHTLSAAIITAEMGLDEDSIIAALLHDCIEDTSVTYDDIAKEFGVAVADIVEGVTKLARVEFISQEEEQMENLRKMLMAMAKDIRVILIKIADRLHNMRTMEFQSEEKQRKKSLETMEIYAPIAHRLGMQKIKWELEDLSLLYLDPVGYREILDVLERRHDALETFMANVEKKIRTRLNACGIHATIYGRIKHIYSIYRKMFAQKKELDEIFDLCAFRVIVDDITDCYNVLGHIHDMFKPIPGRFKDYIGTPKPNMYQSVHTTVIGTSGIPFEVQIRTWEMHHTAEYGIAAHWKYKSGDHGVKTGDEEKFAWVRRLLENQQNSDATEFFRELKVDMFADEVFVFTPQGDVINLPAGATPIDFAYSIHSAIGNRMIGAKVNSRIVPFDHILQNGDIVSIITSKSAPGPSRDWIKLAKSGTARTKIKQWLKKERREENIVHGRAVFESELKKHGLTMADVLDEEILPVLLKKLSMPTLDDLCSSIGYGGMTAVRAVNRIKNELALAHRTTSRTVLDRIAEQAERRTQNQAEHETRAVQGVLVEGMDNCLIKFARCCTPVPGDDIVGFITRGFGVSVHRTDCTNYRNSLKTEDSGRWIRVTWASQPKESYVTTVLILANDRSGLVMDIATVLNTLNAKVCGLSARSLGNDTSMTSLSLEVKNIQDLRSIMNRLATIPGVSEIKRSNK